MVDDQRAALLTKTHRAWLVGESDIDSGSDYERSMLSRLRRRVVRGFEDLALLAAELPSGEREKIAESIAENQGDDGDGQLLLADSLALIYMMTTTAPENLSSGSFDFEHILEQGINRGELYRSLTGVGGSPLNVEVQLILHAKRFEEFDVDGVVENILNDQFHEVSSWELSNFLWLYSHADDRSPEGLRREYNVMRRTMRLEREQMRDEIDGRFE